jgi:hypothetical protein
MEAKSALSAAISSALRAHNNRNNLEIEKSLCLDGVCGWRADDIIARPVTFLSALSRMPSGYLWLAIFIKVIDMRMHKLRAF